MYCHLCTQEPSTSHESSGDGKQAQIKGLLGGLSVGGVGRGTEHSDRPWGFGPLRVCSGWSVLGVLELGAVHGLGREDAPLIPAASCAPSAFQVSPAQGHNYEDLEVIPLCPSLRIISSKPPRQPASRTPWKTVASFEVGVSVLFPEIF